MSDWTESQHAEWRQWLDGRPANVRVIAEAFPPNGRYRVKGLVEVGNYYVPTQYDEHDDGSVTMRCNKFNDEFPALGGINVFGMKPETLERIDP